MRIFSVFLMASLLAACGNDDELMGSDAETGYGGFPAAGAWSEYIICSSGEKFRLESVGTDTLDGYGCLLVEYESAGDGVVVQIWLEKAASQPALLFMKQGSRVFVMGMAGFTDVLQMVSEDSAPTKAMKVGTGRYTTDTGKTVDTVEYNLDTSEGPNELWVSAQVPFSQVETRKNGTPITKLYDFGTAGSSRDISKQDAEDAQSILTSSLPSGTMDVKVFQPATDNGGFFEAFVSDPRNMDLSGTFEGYCIDTGKGMKKGIVYSVRVFPSYGVLPPGLVEYPENLDLVNWMLNQSYVGQPSPSGEVYTCRDVQIVIWKLLEDELPDDVANTANPWNPSRVDEILADAYASGEGFSPGFGGKYALILVPVDYADAEEPNMDPDEPVAQVFLIIVPASGRETS
jgi:hypothetical protein